MAYYLITLTYNLPDGDTTELKLNNVEAESRVAAINKVPTILARASEADAPLVMDILRNNLRPSKIEVTQVPPPPPVDESRYILQPSTRHDDGWVVTDTENQVTLTFREHHFNTTQHITFLSDAPTDELLAARIMREIGDWMAKYHKDIV